MKLKKVNKGFLMLVLLGVALRVAPILYPIHEQFHAEAIGISGGTVTLREADHIEWMGGAHNFILFSGYFGEVMVYGIMALVLRRIGLVAYGVMIVAGLEAVGSADFAQLSQAALGGLILVWLFFVLFAGGVILARVQPSEDDQGEPRKRYGPIRSPLRP